MLFRYLSLLFCLGLWLVVSAAAQEPGPLFEQSPYDVITLTEEGKNAVINVFSARLQGPCGTR